jgi:predicted Zn-ribbon and HTH transcriptional regulator
VRDLSQQVGVPEKQVAAHLEHLAKSLRAIQQRLETEPATCLGCGFAFRKRDKFSAPSRCPRCRSERIAPPRFRIAG